MAFHRPLPKNGAGIPLPTTRLDEYHGEILSGEWMAVVTTPASRPPRQFGSCSLWSVSTCIWRRALRVEKFRRLTCNLRNDIRVGNVQSCPQVEGLSLSLMFLDAPTGEQRDLLIREWCMSVWNVWREERDQIVSLVKNELGIG
jgi:hypothetical protein